MRPYVYITATDNIFGAVAVRDKELLNHVDGANDFRL